MNITSTLKKAELSDYLNCEVGDIDEINDETFSHDGNEYLVLTDDEADQAAADYIRESLWFFKPLFLMCYLPDGVDEEIIRFLQEKKCEDANPSLLSMVGNRLDALIADAISLDGRGHFLASYDSHEIELDTYFAYRID